MIGILKKILFAIYREIFGVIEFIAIYSPRTKIGGLLRKVYWKSRLNIGKNFQIDRGSMVENVKLVQIGNNFLVGMNVWISAGECKGIFIGNDVWISKDSYIRSANHSFDRTDIPMREQGHTCGSVEFNNREYSIVIEDGCWIASNCTILSGSHIGEGAIISTGSVVSGKIPPYSIVIGNPARVISNRKKIKV